MGFPSQGGPQYPMPTQDERTQSMLSWILSIFFGFIPPLIFFLMADGKPFLKRQAALGLTLAIASFVGYFIAGVLSIVFIGLLLVPVILIWVLVVSIQGAIASNKGENFSPGLISGWCQSMFKL